MPRRKGPPPDQDPESGVPGEEPKNPFAQIYPVEPTVKCRLCDDDVVDISPHLRDWHPRTTIQAYLSAFPGAPVRTQREIRGIAKAENPILADEIVVLPEEAEAHPAGWDGAYLSKSLADDADRVFFDTTAGELRSRGFSDHFLISDTAYQKLLVRRLRDRIEWTRKYSSGNKVFNSQDLKDLQVATDRVRQNITELERLRAISAGGLADPIAMRESDFAEAELFIQEHIGEFSARCQTCGDILAPSGLPYWSIAPIDTPEGRTWPVWSPELWELVQEGVIELWLMAFVLRTSIEGLRITAKRRNEVWPDDSDIIIQESKLRRRLDIADRRALALTAVRRDERRVAHE